MQKVKFTESDPARIYHCHIQLLKYSYSRTELVAAYRAAMVTIRTPLLKAQYITAIRARYEAIHIAKYGPVLTDD